MTTTAKENLKKLNKAVKAFKAADKLDVLDRDEERARASWDLFYAAQDIMKTALLGVWISDGMTDERLDQMTKNINNLFN